MSDLMDTKKVVKTNTKAQEGGEIINGSHWQLDHNEYVVVKKNDGTIVTGCKVKKPDEDDLMTW